jgi:hypothetical protein
MMISRVVSRSCGMGDRGETGGKYIGYHFFRGNAEEGGGVGETMGLILDSTYFAGA